MRDELCGCGHAHKDGTECRHGLGASPLSRRAMLGTLAAAGAAGASALMPLVPAAAQSQAGSGRRIDVHYHVFSPEALAIANNPAQRSWTVAGALEELDRQGIATAIASAPSTLPNELTRSFNEFNARIGREHKGRFGQFATLPLPDVDATLKEIEYAYDVLKVDGVGMLTSYGELWLGDPKLRPVFEELNRRKAVIYVHPTDAPCCTHMSYQAPPVLGSWIEWPMATARTILSLLLNNVIQRLPDLRLIFAHDGGTMPMLIGRIAGFTQITRADFRAKFQEIFPNGVEAEYRKLYFDIAQGTYPVNFEAMRKLVPEDHILFGSDYPYFSIATSVNGLEKLALAPDLLRMIERENAQALLPRWRT